MVICKPKIHQHVTSFAPLLFVRASLKTMQWSWGNPEGWPPQRV